MRFRNATRGPIRAITARSVALQTRVQLAPGDGPVKRPPPTCQVKQPRPSGSNARCLSTGMREQAGSTEETSTVISEVSV